MTFVPEYRDGFCAIMFGDDGGWINFLIIPVAFWSENSTETTPAETVTQFMLAKASQNRNEVVLTRVIMNNFFVDG